MSPVNAKYQFRRRSTNKKTPSHRIRGPMGGADCLVLAEAIELKYSVSPGAVAVLTNDNRMHDVLLKCSKIGHKSAKSLGLLDAARIVGYPWSQEIYPVPLHVSKTDDASYVDFFGSWPLPSRKIVQKCFGELTHLQAAKLWELTTEIKTEFGVGPDNMPFLPQIELLQLRFAMETGVYVRKSEIGQRIQRWRKNPASRPVI